MKATEDFLEVVLIAHVTTAAKDLQASSKCSGQKCTDLAKQLVTKFISVSISSIDDVTCNNGSNRTIEDPPEVNVEDPSEVSDGTFEDPPDQKFRCKCVTEYGKTCIKSISYCGYCKVEFLKDEDNKVQNKDHHTKPSFQKDLSMIEQQLATDSVFKQSQNRHHKTF